MIALVPLYLRQLAQALIIENISEVLGAPASCGVSWHLVKEMVLVEMERGSNLEPGVSEEDA